MCIDNWINIIIPLVVMIGTLSGTGFFTKKQIEEERDRHRQDVLTNKRQFAEQLARQREEEVIAVLPFFTFDPLDVTVSGEPGKTELNFTLTNAGSNSAVHPEIIAVSENKVDDATGIVYEDSYCSKNVYAKYKKIPSNDDTIVKVGGQTEFTLYEVPNDNLENTRMIGRDLTFSISFEDLLGNAYTQLIHLEYDAIAKEVTRRIVNAPKRK